jgi:hypothetical protein
MSAEPKQKLKVEETVTIHIRNHDPHPAGEVIVMALQGRAEFKNEDDQEYRVALWRKRAHRNLAIEVLVSPGQTIAFTSEVDEEIHYEILDRTEQVATGHGGGPIKFEKMAIRVGHGGGPII